ncbi:uncharacterized protein N7459_003751 [Penicillium hispanicum]|uniref:uncharacterized protein n=1 Tax=Penicillium hispanicum TaxID=1080232 RepID=UPI002540C270|nr:uncharacterized protein N7459_003751 [Penicillium hispanicum]KAJ5587986.1 hypothetical protein N7459_003751 [Penicillium hispanicum]
MDPPHAPQPFNQARRRTPPPRNHAGCETKIGARVLDCARPKLPPGDPLGASDASTAISRAHRTEFGLTEILSRSILSFAGCMADGTGQHHLEGEFNA